jgi:ribosomal protein S18 acetylase RimI-like enzyme
VSAPRDVAAVQELASRLWPKGWHPGGLGWALARGELAEEVVLFEHAGLPVAWAGRSGAHGPGELLAQVDPTHPRVADTVVEWLVDTPGASRLTIEVYDGDVMLERALLGRGFTRSDVTIVGMLRGVEAGDARLPDGYTLRRVRDDEREARVAVHRAAWKPASLPWKDRRAVDRDAESSFTRERYRAVRDTWLYDPDLDLVAQAADGSLAGCCIAWFDPAIGVAEIEPLGVVPEHRRNGLAVAMCLAVVERVRARGGHEIFINTGPREEYPAPSAAYAKAGFTPRRRGSSYVLERPA